MPRTDINKIRQKIKKRIKKSLEKIKAGYEVIWSEADGCDEYGYKYWIECKNGYSGRDWDVNPALYRSIKNYRINIIENGFVYNGATYYIHPSYYSNPKGRIKFITKNQYKNMSSQMSKIKSVIKKYIDYVSDLVQKEYYKFNPKMSSEDLVKYKTLIEHKEIFANKVYSTYNLELFYLTIKETFYTDYEYDIMLNKFKKNLANINLTPDELELFN